MPLLKKETEIFPEAFFELPQGEYPWWIAHTKSRREKALARHLESCGVPFYLPQHGRRVTRGGRTLVSWHPLFSGYAFLRGSAAQRVAALRSNVVARLLTVADQDRLASELAQLRNLQESGACLTPVSRFEAGESVRVTEGPFAGYTGTVLQEKGHERLLVSVSVLRRTICVEFSREIVASAFPGRAKLAV